MGGGVLKEREGWEGVVWTSRLQRETRRYYDGLFTLGSVFKLSLKSEVLVLAMASPLYMTDLSVV
jgi:hypothetical protein